MSAGTGLAHECPWLRSRAGTAALDVIIVNYNAGNVLIDTVQSVLQSDVDARIVISDNGSGDGSIAALLRTFGEDPRLCVVENGTNLGFAAANNRVLSLASAPYVLFLNPDCIVAPRALAEMLRFMDATPCAGMSGCVIRNPDGSEQRASRRRIPDPWSALLQLFRLHSLWPAQKGGTATATGLPLPPDPTEVEAISGSLMLVRREALNAVGPLDEGYFLHCEDLDWFVRFRELGWRIYLVPGAEAIHHQGTCSRTSPIRVEWHKHRGMARFYAKFQARRHGWAFNLVVLAGIWTHFALVGSRLGVKRLMGGAAP
jgi:GT2 family glycosyltransferase